MNEKTLQNDTSLTAGVVDELAQIAAEKEQQCDKESVSLS